MSKSSAPRELSAREIDRVAGGHTFVPPETPAQSIANLPGRTVGLVGDVGAIPGAVAGNAQSGSGLLG